MSTYYYRIDSKRILYYQMQGSSMLRGPAGKDGQAATIQIGAVTSSTVPTVVNVGTSTNAILNFGLQPGEQGPTGATGPVGPAGPPGDDYILTNQDKNDIADIVYGMLNNLANGSY